MRTNSIVNRTILIGDVMQKIKEIPDKSINCVISSPPYWGLRDYNVEGQWGSEPTYEEFLGHLGELMNEIKRVLRDDGTVWINLGDTYAGGGGKANEQSFQRDKGIITESNPDFPAKSRYRSTMGKSRFGIPERFYIQCINNGWIARNHIPWIKMNAMPQSVQDRFTNKWESIFFLVKNQRYYFNLDAVREKPLTFVKPPKEKPKLKPLFDLPEEVNGIRGNQQPNERSHFGTGSDIKKHMETKYKKELEKEKVKYGEDKGNRSRISAWVHTANQFDSFNERRQSERDSGTPHEIAMCNPKGKNPGDVFFINTKPFVDAHFATFPVELPLKCLMCGCPPDGFVLDPFFGAGTVGVAAEMLGINWIGIELNKEYAEIARKRLSKWENERL